jgi:antitoxin (DNA-binding transcriptional repressor) of toxin-antitoxin stability system
MYYSCTMSSREADMAVSPVTAEAPTSEVEDEALVYTMRDLNQQTARIMGEIEKTGRPAFITRHGRFVAIITPVAPGQVESRVLAEMAREIGKRKQS